MFLLFLKFTPCSKDVVSILPVEQVKKDLPVFKVSKVPRLSVRTVISDEPI